MSFFEILNLSIEKYMYIAFFKIKLFDLFKTSQGPWRALNWICGNCELFKRILRQASQ